MIRLVRSHADDPRADPSRRAFLRILVGGTALLALDGVPAEASDARRAPPFHEHPDPRPGIDGSRVTPADRVPPHLADLFDGVREHPEIVDGIGCWCGCSTLPGMVSLLSCYEGSAMASYCSVCQGEGRLAVRLAREGRSLDEIRDAIDRRFG